MSLFKDGLRCPMWMTAFYFRPAIQDLPLDGFDPSPVESDEKKNQTCKFRVGAGGRESEI